MKKIVSLCFTLILITSSHVVFAANDYVIYIDAGSSGTRLYLYNVKQATSYPLISTVLAKKTKPGLSSYADYAEFAGPSLKKLLDKAHTFLMNKNINEQSVSLYLYATAGMRLLPKEKQDEIYMNVYDYIKQHYAFKIEEIKTITGHMEGLYAWIEVNYLLDYFKADTKSTVGIIEMGGASTQIAFATAKSHNTYPVNINHNEYNIYSQSFLGLGQNEAIKQMSNHANAISCYPINYELDKRKVGFFDMNLCSATFNDVIQQYQMSSIADNENKKFIAFSNFYHTYKFFKVDDNPTKNSLENSIKDVCYNLWEKMKNNYPKVKDELLSTYCAKAIYFNELIYNTYRIKNLEVKNKIQKQEIKWTLGAAIYNLDQNK